MRFAGFSVRAPADGLIRYCGQLLQKVGKNFEYPTICAFLTNEMAFFSNCRRFSSSVLNMMKINARMTCGNENDISKNNEGSSKNRRQFEKNVMSRFDFPEIVGYSKKVAEIMRSKVVCT